MDFHGIFSQNRELAQKYSWFIQGEWGHFNDPPWLILVKVGSPTKDPPKTNLWEVPNHFQLKFASVEDIYTNDHK